MYPMDFEEFLWAIGDEISADTIRILIKNKKPAGRYKLFTSDIGLFVTLVFKDKSYTENGIYYLPIYMIPFFIEVNLKNVKNANRS